MITSKRTLEGWVHKSLAIPVPQAGGPTILIYYLQSLGRLDIDLTGRWTRRSPAQEVDDLNEQLFMTSLWLMGAYELVRELNKLDKRQEVADAHELFRRVRVPLVKFETPQKKRGVADYPDDFGIAYPAIGGHEGLGWNIGPGLFISRDQLAQSLYDLY